MSRRFVIVAEDRLSFLLATSLCDRVIAERSSWLCDHWESEEGRSAFRVWSKLDTSSREEWTTRSDVKRLAREMSLRAHPLGLKAEGAIAYKAARLALAWLAGDDERGALFIVHDSDGDATTSRSMRDGAREAMREKRASERLAVVVAVPHPEAEAWVIAGIVPATPEERARHEDERRGLGFDPITAPHALSSRKSTDKRDAKRICEAILGSFALDPARWRRCWEETALSTLEANASLVVDGEVVGLSAFTKQVEEIIVPLLGDRARSFAHP